ncbi:MAG: hypothetical protein GEU90_17115 [Gemmatimonas sp.]|nr:hypothetical protein [Gemmatimonas sp.]
MYYDDEARRYNFASGLLLGTVLGTGLGLLAAPRRRTGKPGGISSSEALKRASRDRLGSVSESLSKARQTARRVAR